MPATITAAVQPGAAPATVANTSPADEAAPGGDAGPFANRLATTLKLLGSGARTSAPAHGLRPSATGPDSDDGHDAAATGEDAASGLGAGKAGGTASAPGAMSADRPPVPRADFAVPAPSPPGGVNQSPPGGVGPRIGGPAAQNQAGGPAAHKPSQRTGGTARSKRAAESEDTDASHSSGNGGSLGPSVVPVLPLVVPAASASMKSVPASGSAKPPPDPGKPLAAAALSQHAVSEEKSSPLLDAARTGPAAGAAARDFAAHVASDERSGQTGGQPNPIDAPTLAGAVPTQSPASASPPQVAHSTPAAASPDAAAQVAPAVVSLVQTGDGGQRLVLHLQPAELGQVQVRIDRTDGAPARVEITVQRPETAQMLLRDQSQLQHALDQAGIPQDGRSLTIQVAADAAWASPSSPVHSGDLSGRGLLGSGGFTSGGSAGGGFAGSGSGGGHSSNPHQPKDDGSAGRAAYRWFRAGLDMTA